MSTVTVWPPGLIVSGVPRVASPDASTVIVTLCPAARIPDVCERLMLPSSPDGTEMDQLTGPPLALSVNDALLPTARAMLLVDTESVPWLAPAEPDGLGELEAADDGLGEADETGAADPPDPEEEEDDDDGPDDADVDVDVVAPPVRLTDGVPADPPRAAADVAPPSAGSADGLADRDLRPGRTVMVLSCAPAPCEEASGTVADEAAPGITAVTGTDVAPAVVVVWWPAAAKPVAVAATATVPTAATASRGAVIRPSRPPRAFGNPSSPKLTRRPPRARRQTASGPLSLVIR